MRLMDNNEIIAGLKHDVKHNLLANEVLYRWPGYLQSTHMYTSTRQIIAAFLMEGFGCDISCKLLYVKSDAMHAMYLHLCIAKISQKTPYMSQESINGASDVCLPWFQNSMDANAQLALRNYSQNS